MRYIAPSIAPIQPVPALSPIYAVIIPVLELYVTHPVNLPFAKEDTTEC